MPDMPVPVPVPTDGPKLPQDPRQICGTCGELNTDGHHHTGGEPGTGV